MGPCRRGGEPLVSRLWWIGALACLAAVPAAPLRVQAQDTTAQSDRLPPVGKGSLRQENISVGIDDGSVQFRLMPLDELILRLLAPDSYTSPHSLREMRSAEIQEAAERFGVMEPVVFFVTVFGMREQAQFDPDQLVVTSRNRLFRPIAILPVTQQWNQHRVSQRETAGAIYVFESGIAMLEPFTVEYAGVRSDQWSTSLRLVERERARIAAQRNEPQ
jgi:hypothetical protein